MDDYERLIGYLSSLEKVGTHLGLDGMKRISESLGSPQDSYMVIHVAGTNGKGSVCAILSSVLRECGYRVGMYTSPYLVDVREKIMVDGEKISREEMVRYSEIIKSEYAGLTYFEFLTAVAFLYFRDRGVDFAVVEVGLGGRLDATNIVKPVVSVITNIGMEHTNFLGNDLRGIAREKAGIIKPGIPVVTGSKGEALEEITGKARKSRSRLIRAKDSIRVISSDLDSQKIDHSGTEVEFPLLGGFQIENLNTAMETIRVLRSMGADIPVEKIKAGLEKTRWPGRAEIAGMGPMVIFDGAHNPDGVRALVEFVRGLKFRKMILLMGISSDKDREGMTEGLFPMADKIILTESSYRAMSPEKIAKKGCIIEKDPGKAMERAEKLAGKKDLILATGSLYLIGDLKRKLSARKKITANEK